MALQVALKFNKSQIKNLLSCAKCWLYSMYVWVFRQHVLAMLPEYNIQMIEVPPSMLLVWIEEWPDS